MDKPSEEKRKRLLSLYDEAPYPEVLQGRLPQNTPLLNHWVDAAVAPQGPALRPNGHFLVAGCGSGEEALMLAQLYPQAKVLGVDFSPRSIELAKKRAQAALLTNLSFAVADLTESGQLEQYAPFHFILCHAVADYVTHPQALMNNLAAVVASDAVIYMTMNSPHHPAWRIRKAFEQLGIAAEDFEDSPRQRNLMQLVDKLMGSNAGILGLGQAAAAYLKVDIFPPIAQHDSMATWCHRAQEAGLYFCGSMDAPLGLMNLSDEQVALLYSLGKADLSIWVAELCRHLGMQLLFSRRPPTEPSFDSPSLWQWKPRLAGCIGQLPPLEGDPAAPRHLTLRFAGLPDFVIYSTAYDLELLRQCNGLQSLSEIIAAIPAQGDMEQLRACLFRAYHYGLLQG